MYFKPLFQASDGRDALAKFLFDRMFEWLIYRINVELAPKEAASKNFAFIGVLDIFGFEIFSVNRFEQLCINYANEKLQQHFNKHIFQMEQEEYKNDGLNVQRVEFVDNQVWRLFGFERYLCVFDPFFGFALCGFCMFQMPARIVGYPF